MVIRKKWCLTTIKTYIALMIDGFPYLYHWQVGALPSTGNHVTNAWETTYQVLVICLSYMYNGWRNSQCSALSREKRKQERDFDKQ